MLMTPIQPHEIETVADALDRLGGVSPQRIRLRPYPATVADVMQIEKRENRLFELVDGMLVEKVMGHPESRVASALIAALERFLEDEDLGAVSGEGGMFELPDSLVRIPDVAFARWEKFSNEEATEQSVPKIVPDLAVEVLSQGNTTGEMTRKLREYFRAGVGTVWFVDLDKKAVTVYSSPKRFTVLGTTDVLDGSKFLPGFKLPVAKLFARLKQRPKRKN